VPVFLLMMLIVRGLPTLVGYRRILPGPELIAMALMSATGLPLIVVVTTVGVTDGQVATHTAAALVTAGVLSVLILPALGGWVLRRSVRQQRHQ
jgi:hypothetical protein